MRLSKEILINAAKEAQKEKSNIYVVYDNKEVKIITDSSCKCSDDFFKKYNMDYNKNLLQAFTPDMILKYQCANWNGGTGSLENFIDTVNNNISELISI